MMQNGMSATLPRPLLVSMLAGCSVAGQGVFSGLDLIKTVNTHGSASAASILQVNDVLVGQVLKWKENSNRKRLARRYSERWMVEKDSRINRGWSASEPPL